MVDVQMGKMTTLQRSTMQMSLKLIFSIRGYRLLSKGTKVSRRLRHRLGEEWDHPVMLGKNVILILLYTFFPFPFCELQNAAWDKYDIDHEYNFNSSLRISSTGII